MGTGMAEVGGIKTLCTRIRVKRVHNGTVWLPKPDSHQNNVEQMEAVDLAYLYDHFPIYLTKLGDGISIFIGEKPALQFATL